MEAEADHYVGTLYRGPTHWLQIREDAAILPRRQSRVTPAHLKIECDARTRKRFNHLRLESVTFAAPLSG